MTNEQLKGARRAQNRYPDVVFRAVPTGVEVAGQTVVITQNMSADDVFRALSIAAIQAQNA